MNMMINNLRKQRGFTLVELMIVVAIVGILAALAIYGVRKYIANAKTAEARNSLGQLGKDAVTAYAREGMATAVLAVSGQAGVSNRLCLSAGHTVPSAIAKVKGQKYQSGPSEWQEAAGTDQLTGWNCVKFSMSDPQYFMYNYTQTGTATDATGKFSGTAQGDLDGDGNPSTFTILGGIIADGTKLVAVLAPNIQELNPDE
jgi:type IV pilus assembly protein PilA